LKKNQSSEVNGAENDRKPTEGRGKNPSGGENRYDSCNKESGILKKVGKKVQFLKDISKTKKQRRG